MKTLLLALLCGLACAHLHQDASQAAGAWNTVYIAASNVEKVQENGVMRTHFRRIDCDEGCQTISFDFYVREDGVCKKYTVVGIKNAHGVYSSYYAGNNYYHVVFLSENIIVFNNVHVEGKETTHLTLVAARGKSLSEEEQEEYQELVKENGIPEENVEHVINTDTCPQ